MPWEPERQPELRLGRGADPRIGVERPWPRLVPVGGVITPAIVVNVGDYASGDGSDETARIGAAIEALPREGGVLYFPPGTYGVGSVDPLVLEDRRCITLVGAPGRVIIRRVTGAAAFDEGRGLVFDAGPGILRIENCDDITIRDLTLDGRGWVPAGDNLRALVTVYRSRGVRIERNRVIDSFPNESLATLLEDGIGEEYSEPHSVAFGFFHHVVEAELGDADLSSRITVVDNHLDSFGVAAHHVRDVRISGNRIVHARSHGIALGAEALVQGAVQDRIEIEDNFVEDPSGYGIVVADIAAGTGGRISDVRISGNRVQKLTQARQLLRGIVAGTLRDRLGDPGGPYDRIQIADNLVQLPGPVQRQDVQEQAVGIWMQVTVPQPDRLEDLTLLGGEVQVDLMTDCVVLGNVVTGARSLSGGAGIVVQDLHRGAVAGNGVYESSSGLQLRGYSRLNHVHDNRVERGPAQPGDSAPYEMTVSLGGNWLSGNAVLDQPPWAFWTYPRYGDDGLANGDQYPPDLEGGR